MPKRRKGSKKFASRVKHIQGLGVNTRGGYSKRKEEIRERQGSRCIGRHCVVVSWRWALITFGDFLPSFFFFQNGKEGRKKEKS